MKQFPTGHRRTGFSSNSSTNVECSHLRHYQTTNTVISNSTQTSYSSSVIPGSSAIPSTPNPLDSVCKGTALGNASGSVPIRHGSVDTWDKNMLARVNEHHQVGTCRIRKDCCYLQPHNRKISHPDLSLEHIHGLPSVKKDRRVALVKRYQGMLAQAFRHCMTEREEFQVRGRRRGGSNGRKGLLMRLICSIISSWVEACHYLGIAPCATPIRAFFHIPVVLSTDEELRPGGPSRACSL
ncbi:hypothetical protein EDB89DRAFT_2017206 [Lactarius sanguifluus]|nr:hypothetical protein EDB89DRAFT_2017206 [Lactarius sanguifluus]